LEFGFLCFAGSRIRAILNIVGVDQSVRWICLREEPMIYLNDRSFVLRDIEHPFRNLKDFQKIDWRRIEEIENRLKQDVLREAERNGGNILIHRELGEDDLRPCWEAVTKGTVKTSREIYDEVLRADGYDVVYSRVPTTPQSTMSYKDLDHIIRMFNRVEELGSSHFVFNCQMGQGRSTASSALMALIYMAANHYSHEFLESEEIKTEAFPKDGKSDKSEFPEVLKLIRLLDNGQLAKKDADLAIEICGGVFNLKEDLIECVKHMETARDASTLKLYSTRVAQAMDRYCLLICFASYLRDIGDIRNPRCSFQEFVLSNSGIDQFRHSLLRGELARVSSYEVLSTSEIENEIIRPPLSRRGSVLQEETILKRTFFLPLKESEKLHVLDGAPNFAKVGGLPLAAMAQPDKFGIENALSLMTAETDKVCWISFQAEPIIFLNGFPFTVRDRSHPFRSLKEFNLNLPSQRLAQISKRLKKDILLELAHSADSTILAHQELESLKLTPISLHLSEDQVLTADEIFEEIAGVFSLRYRHIPLPADDLPSLSCFDELFDVFDKFAHESAFVFHCQMGRGRSTFGMVAAAIFLRRKGAISLDSLDDEEGKTDLPEALEFSAKGSKFGDFKAILSLCRVLKKGRIVKDEVDVAIDVCSKTHNVREAIFEVLRSYETERSGAAQQENFLKLAAVNLVRYGYLIVWNSYLYDIFLQKLPAFIPFTTWWNSRPELQTWFEQVMASPEAALKSDIISTSSDVSNVFDSRSGNVLVRYSILKSDYFPGCQNKKLLPIIEGAPNYRKIKAFPVVGVAIPSGNGVRNVLKEIAAASGVESPPIFWTNLREEPLLYVCDRPYCLRDVDDPMQNLIYTGITTRRVEAMEKQLKVDALADATKYSQKLMLHHEADDNSLIAVWETISQDDIKTCQEMYTSAMDSQIGCNYSRVPVTDEQAPLPETFDFIVQMCMGALQNKLKNVHFVFNCQMGRGRTTTGIVICCLWIWKCRDIINMDRKPDISVNSPRRSLIGALSGNRSKPPVANTPAEEAKMVEDALNKGEYKTIMKLVRLLAGGPLVKAEVDAIIDHCSEMQNLRTAIFNLKTRAETVTNVKAQHEAHHRGVAYLVRYFYLICFNQYLQDAFDGRFQLTFAEWLKDRPEIGALLEDIDLSY
jgi:protein-tyrosine phosphatase